MSLLAALLLWMACASAHAVIYICAPKTERTPNEAGTQLVEGELKGFGTWSYYWCEEPASTPKPPGVTTAYRLMKHAVLDKYKNSVPDPMASIRAVLRAPNLALALDAAASAARVVPAKGSDDSYRLSRLLYLACQVAATPPYTAPIAPLPSDYCGAPPVPPGPAPDVWRTPNTGTFKLYTAAGGFLTGLVAGRTATPNALADCAANRATSGSSVYCALAGGPATEVTLVQKAPP